MSPSRNIVTAVLVLSLLAVGTVAFAVDPNTITTIAVDLSSRGGSLLKLMMLVLWAVLG